MVNISICTEKCKGCLLCVQACPRGILAQTITMNAMGYFIVNITEEHRCNGCALCARMCPDLAIEIYREVSNSA